MSQNNILLETGTNELEIVEFLIDEEGADGSPYHGHYGVNVAKVLEIIRMPKVTEMPDSRNPAVLGAFNLRSHIIPLVDLSMWLGISASPTDNAKVVVTEFNRVTTAFKVSGVNRIHRLSWEEVEPPSAYVSSFSSDSITGVVKLSDRIIFILDLERIVADLNPSLGLHMDHALESTEGERYRAIIADDSALIRNMLKSLLEKANFEVETVNNGRECWERLCALADKAAADGRPLTDYLQIVISDIEMPAMDGHSLTKRIKQHQTLGALPVILFSSLISDKLYHKGESVGADDQITKPEVGQLAIRSKELIRKYRETASA